VGGRGWIARRGGAPAGLLGGLRGARTDTDTTCRPTMDWRTAMASGLLVGGAMGACLGARSQLWSPSGGSGGGSPSAGQLATIVRALDAVHDASPPREGGEAPGQVLSEREYCCEVEHWVRELWAACGSGRGSRLPPALLLAARAQHLVCVCSDGQCCCCRARVRSALAR
jgi:hypothetical protein